MKLKIGMLLPIRCGPNMRVNPQIGIASYLVKFGHEITWIMSAEKSRTAQQSTLNGVNVFAAAYIHYFREISLPGKVLNLIPTMYRRVRLAYKVFREGRYDLVFVREDALDGLAGTCIQRKYKIPLVYELTDPLEQEWEGYKIENRRPLFLWYLLAKMKAWLKVYIMKRADLVLITTWWFEEGLVKKGIPESKLMAFPNGVDLESFADKESKGIREKYRLGDTKVLIYLGVMGKVRKLELLIQAFAEVKKVKSDIKLLMVGDGTGRKDLEELAHKLGLEEDVIFTGQVPQSEVPHFIAAADIGVSPVPPFSYYRVSSPIKALECMAAGKPVVANEEIYEHKEILKASGGGILAQFSAESFAHAIIELLDKPEIAAAMGKKGYKWVVKNRSYEILARKLEEKYMQLVATAEKTR